MVSCRSSVGYIGASNFVGKSAHDFVAYDGQLVSGVPINCDLLVCVLAFRFPD